MSDHDHAWAEDMDEVRANCPLYNSQIPDDIRCPGDQGPMRICDLESKE